MTQDKFELHYRQQLSALIDGELAADESRFLLRRLEHDQELSGCHERWQLLGDVLRGTACAPAPAEFASRVHAAVAAEPRPVTERGASRTRTGWRWGGGAAIAASVAALALFMVREWLPDQGVVASKPMAVLATTAQLPAPASKSVPAATGGTLADAVAAAPVLAVAATRRPDTAAPRRGSATRTQQLSRGLASRQQQTAERRVATVGSAAGPASAVATVAVAPAADPFAHPATLQSKPWPRSMISGDSPLNTGFGRQPAFYPFEPTPPAQATVAEPPLPLP